MSHFLRTLLDQRNTKLWNELSSSYNIALESSDEPNYRINFKEDIITIFIDENDLKPAGFTLELLHIYIKSKGVGINNDLKNKIDENDFLYYLFSTDLKEHLGNCLEHIKMLPIFMELGFKNSEFISDFDKKKMSKGQQIIINENYRNGDVYDREAVDSFIGLFFAMKADNNKMHKYHNFYKGFLKLDKTLYKSLFDFWEDWLDFDINDPDDSYEEIIQYFVEDLNTWVDNKAII